MIDSGSSSGSTSLASGSKLIDRPTRVTTSSSFARGGSFTPLSSSWAVSSASSVNTPATSAFSSICPTPWVDVLSSPMMIVRLENLSSTTYAPRSTLNENCDPGSSTTTVPVTVVPTVRRCDGAPRVSPRAEPSAQATIVTASSPARVMTASVSLATSWAPSSDAGAGATVTWRTGPSGVTHDSTPRRQDGGALGGRVGVLQQGVGGTEVERGVLADPAQA